MPDTQRPLTVTLQVVSIVLFTFIGYLNIGIPLAVLPGYVHSDLGFGAVIAGLVISVQYLATLLSRPYAGRIIDNLGCKRAVMYGLAGCGLSGIAAAIAASSLGWFNNARASSARRFIPPDRDSMSSSKRSSSATNASHSRAWADGTPCPMRYPK